MWKNMKYMKIEKFEKIENKMEWKERSITF